MVQLHSLVECSHPGLFFPPMEPLIRLCLFIQCRRPEVTVVTSRALSCTAARNPTLQYFSSFVEYAQVPVRGGPRRGQILADKAGCRSIEGPYASAMGTDASARRDPEPTAPVEDPWSIPYDALGWHPRLKYRYDDPEVAALRDALRQYRLRATRHLRLSTCARSCTDVPCCCDC